MNITKPSLMEMASHDCLYLMSIAGKVLGTGNDRITRKTLWLSMLALPLPGQRCDGRASGAGLFLDIAIPHIATRH